MDESLAQNTSPESAEAAAITRELRTTDWGKLHDEGKTMFRFSENWATDIVEV